MIALTESFRKVHYGLRPAKQVERRMLIDALLLLTESGFPIRDYEYLGMGCVHFIDFAMFHKYLGICKMTSVEASEKLASRVEFNTPYRNAIHAITGKEIGDIIATIAEDKPYVVWLDYDSILCDYMLRDMSLAVSRLAPGSVLLITVDTERPKPTDDVTRDMTLEETRSYFEGVARPYLSPFHKDEDFDYENLPKVIIEALRGAIMSGLAGFRDKEFMPLFNFLYKDTHRMLTVGGMIGGSLEKRKIKRSRLPQTEYSRLDLSRDPCVISVPCLTRKEVLYLESHMPAKENWRPTEVELAEEDVAQFAKIYRFFPTYAELFL